MMMLLSEADSNFISQRQSIFATNINLIILSEVFMVKEVDNISLRAKLVRNVINMVSSGFIIGPAIKKGTIRRRLVEPPWHCPDGYSVAKIHMKHFEMELLSPENTGSRFVVLQLHGGGYIGKMRNVYRNFAKEYCEMRGGIKTLSIDYRVAPKNPFPAALDDAVAAYKWLLATGYEGRDIITAGDSAGGGLSLALSQYLRDNDMPLPAGLVLMSPWTDLTASGASYDDNYTLDPLFGNTRESMIYSGEYLGGHSPKEPYISPLFGDFSKLPPMLFQVGGIEMLLSDSVLAEKKAREAGCKTNITIYEEMFHVFQMGLERLEESKNAWAEVKRFVEEFEE